MGAGLNEMGYMRTEMVPSMAMEAELLEGGIDSMVAVNGIMELGND
jgi:hypothetical protein